MKKLDQPFKICIVGAGAIGGFLGARLAANPSNLVSAFARGKTLVALREQGWRLSSREGLLQTPIHCASSDAADLGVQDLVIIAVKGQSLAEVAPQLSPLIDVNTVIMPAMNGVPWWFMQSQPAGQGQEGLWDQPLKSIDPAGIIARALPVHQVVGCVVHASTSAASPGWVQHHGGQKLILGEPAGGESARVKALVQILLDAGFEAVPSNNIRYDIWYKLWGNMTMNPVSALTGATIDKILDDPLTRGFCSSVMRETQAIGARIDCNITESIDNRHAVTAKLGAFKTSMLQDVEAGRALELDAIVGAAFEIGQRLGLPTDNIGAVLGLTRVFAQERGLSSKKALPR